MTLLTIIPIAVARQSGPNGRFGSTGSRMVRQRRARRGKMPVAATAESNSSQKFARRISTPTCAHSMPWSRTAIVSRGVETRWEPIGVWLRGPLAVGITGGLGGGAGAALGADIVAIFASARMRGVITGVGAVENVGAGAAAGIA